MPKLEELLQAEVEAEIEAILSEADTKAAKIISDAESLAAARVATHQKKIEAEARAATQQAHSAADLSIANARIQAKGEVIDLLHQKVGLALEETSSQPGYRKMVRALAEEAMGVAEAAETLVVHPDDKKKLRDWAEQKGLELRTDPGLRLGIRILSKSGATVENTLPVRLYRAWNTLMPKVTKLLWE